MVLRRYGALLAGILSLGILSASFPALSFAQDASPQAALPSYAPPASTTSPPEEITQSLVPSGSTITPSGDLSSCFNYYTFGSVSAALSSNLQTVSAGAPMAVQAYVTNTNDYPLVDTALYIKVFKENADTSKNVNGPDVVDFFPAAGDLSFKPHERKLVTFLWTPPTDADPGQYRMTTYIVQDNRFNFLGLTFTDDITGGSYAFSIINDAKGGVRFDKSQATLNGQSYRFAAYSPIVLPGTKDVPVTIVVNNTTSSAYNGSISWQLYYWDALKPGALIGQTSEPLQIPAGGSAAASYTASDTAHSVYYLVGQLATPAGSKSIAAFRFVRQGTNEPRLSSVDISGNPSAPGAVAFACFHSSGTAQAESVKVQLSVKTLPLFGLFSWTLASKSYSGIAPGNLVALTVPLKGAGNALELDARISQNGTLLDEVKVPYTCQALGGSCVDWQTPTLIGVTVLVLLLLAWLILRAWRRRKKAPVASSGSSTIPPPSSL